MGKLTITNKRLPLGIRTPIRLKIICFTLWQKNVSTFSLCSEIFQDIELKGSELTDLEEKILRQPSIQGVAWVLVVSFIKKKKKKTKQKV